MQNYCVSLFYLLYLHIENLKQILYGKQRTYSCNVV